MKIKVGNQLILNKQKDDDDIRTVLGTDTIAEVMISISSDGQEEVISESIFPQFFRICCKLGRYSLVS
jgi:2-phosphoglycerate kinase